MRADKMKKGKEIEITVGDVFGIPVKNNNDQCYEICRFLIEELVGNDVRHLSSIHGRLVDNGNSVKIGTLDRKKAQSRRRVVEIQSRSTNELLNRIPPSPLIQEENIFPLEDLDSLRAEINYLRKANESINCNNSEEESVLQRAHLEVQQARKKLSDWAFQRDTSNEITANIEALVS